MGKIARFWSLKHSRSPINKTPQSLNITCFPKTQDSPTAKTLAKYLMQTLNLQRYRYFVSLQRPRLLPEVPFLYLQVKSSVVQKETLPHTTPTPRIRCNQYDHRKTFNCFADDKRQRWVLSQNYKEPIHSTHKIVGIVLQKARKCHLPASMSPVFSPSFSCKDRLR